MRHRVVGQHDAPGVVGAQVHPDAIAHRQHRAVSPRRDLDVVHLGARVGRAHHVLAAVLGPLHRPARHDGGGGDQQVLRVAVRLGAEAAAHVRGDDADLVRRQPERGHQSLLDEVDDLGAVPRGERAVARIPLGDHAARLDRHAHVARDHEALAHPRVGLAEGRLDVAEAGLERERDVVAPGGIEHGRVRPRGRLHVGQRGQRLVVHLDQLAAVLGHRAATRPAPSPRSRPRAAPRPGTSRAGGAASW